MSPESPEARAERQKHGEAPRVTEATGWPVRAWEVTRRVAIGVYSDGFIHAGNLAYLALLTVFPFFIVAGVIASLLGGNADVIGAVAYFLDTLPGEAAELLRQPIGDVLAARAGSLPLFGALIGIWTVGSFIETIRDIFRRAYGTPYRRAFWRYRLGAMAATVMSVILALIAFLVQGVLLGVEQFVYRLLPWAQDVAGWIRLSRLIPDAVMFGALYMLFYTVTPSRYRDGECRKWPGALLTTLWWVAATAILPLALAQLGGYSLTYGGLAGVIVTLFFFWLVGLGIVVGAHLNAALAEAPGAGVKEPPVQG
ncbi:YihY/virulence factor BrkB family protein [Sphingomonas quercus]|uniref:YihY/virulence factor BrkB family protein n=1 Tax=Sphingomonas quercus TaxID=2842451 RepID=A0ABS6BJL6_9SPHN|nr:YihY/virulence factor BrkB family protein [Sphingomonas quercus]MBU3078011.1 YihY/virulence factor BrkB family protein [Sphingomonas quercus]